MDQAFFFFFFFAGETERVPGKKIFHPPPPPHLTLLIFSGLGLIPQVRFVAKNLGIKTASESLFHAFCLENSSAFCGNFYFFPKSPPQHRLQWRLKMFSPLIKNLEKKQNTWVNLIKTVLMLWLQMLTLSWDTLCQFSVEWVTAQCTHNAFFFNV